MALISNNDLFCIERQGRSYKWTGAELNLQIQEISPIAEIVADLPIEVDVTNRVVTISIRDGTINEKGAVKLTNTVNNSETLALTPKGAKTELDKKANLTGDNAAGTWPININGNASTATNAIDSINSQKIFVKRDTNSNQTRYITFVNSTTVENKDLTVDGGLSYNPLSNTLTTEVFKGSLDGKADSATQADNATNANTATNAVNVGVINDGSNASRYLTFASIPEGNDKIRTDGGLRYNPFNNILSTTNIECSNNITSENTLTGKTVVSTEDTYVGRNFIVQKGSDNKAVIYNDGSAYFSNEQIWLYNNGNVKFNDVNCKNISASGSVSVVNLAANQITAKNATLTGKIKSTSAEITGNLSASGISAKTADFSGNLSAQNGTFSGNIAAVNITASNKVSARDANLSYGLTAKSASISTKLTANSIEASSGKITSALTTGSLSTGAFNATSGDVTNNLSVGSITGGAATLGGKLTAGSAQINGDFSAKTATISGPLSATSAAISGGLSSASASISGSLTSNTINTNNLSVSVDASIGRNLNCSHIITAEAIKTSGDIRVGNNLIVQTGDDKKAVIYNDGGAYFADTKIWLYNTGDTKFVNVTCKDIAAEDVVLSGGLTSNSVSSNTITTSSITSTGMGQFGNITTGSISASGNIAANRIDSKQLYSSEWLIGQYIESYTSIYSRGDVVAGNNLVVSQDAFVNSNFVVRNGDNNTAVIYNDGTATFADENIILRSSGNITCRDVNSKSDRRFKTDIQPVSDALTSLKKLNGVKFKWTDTDDKSMGVIAQDVEEVFPELVSEKEEFKSVNYNGLVGVLIEAVKELSARVEELENTK